MTVHFTHAPATFTTACSDSWRAGGWHRTEDVHKVDCVRCLRSPYYRSAVRLRLKQNQDLVAKLQAELAAAEAAVALDQAVVDAAGWSNLAWSTIRDLRTQHRAEQVAS